VLVVGIGLASAVIFGAADFLGGLAARRVSAIQVTAIGAVAGLVCLSLGSLLIEGHWSWASLILGGLSGIAGALAISLLYACLAMGPMSILAPVMAVVSAIVPTAAGAIRGQHLTAPSYVAAALVLVAAVLIGLVPESNAVRPSVRAVLMAVGAGVMIGAFLIIIDLTPADSGLTALVANRAANATIMSGAVIVIAIARRRIAQRTGSPAADDAAPRAANRRAGVLLAVTGGAVDAVANSLMLLGLRLGDLTVMSVLISLSPGATAILAARVLGERIGRLQMVGIAVALTASALFAAQ
jgi:drug/metabolite transporter (DMT)-like permease